MSVSGINSRRHRFERYRCKADGRETRDEQRAIEVCELHDERMVLLTILSKCCIGTTVSKKWCVRVWMQLTIFLWLSNSHEILII